MITLLLRTPCNDALSQSWHELLELLTLQALFGQKLRIVIFKEAQEWLNTTKANDQQNVLWQTLMDMQPELFTEQNLDNFSELNTKQFVRTEAASLIDPSSHMMVF